MPGDFVRTFPPCPRRYLDIWCLHVFDDLPLPKRPPATNAEMLNCITEIGRVVANAFCRRVQCANCLYPPDTIYYNAWTRTLWIRGKLIRKYRRDAENQAVVLDAFQKANWPPRLENVFGRPDPFMDARHKVSETVRELKEHQPKPKPLYFWVERGTQAVLWELLDGE